MKHTQIFVQKVYEKNEVEENFGNKIHVLRNPGTVCIKIMSAFIHNFDSSFWYRKTHEFAHPFK